ncbi:Uncharacterised protein [uncultured archaeon]|nr:Uncharacterised protein [uncultured archaeon]
MLAAPFLALIHLGAMPFVLFLDDLIPDMTLVLKIFVLLTIVSYVLQHLGKGPLAWMVIAVLSYFIIFDYFYIFGGIYVLYMLVLFGATQILMDFFILAPQAAMEQQMHGGEEGGGEHMTGQEFGEKQKRMAELRHRAGMR